MLGGRLCASLPAGRLEYRRRFKLHNGMVLALGAGAQYHSGGGRGRRRRFKPFLGCQLQLTGGDGDGGEQPLATGLGRLDSLLCGHAVEPAVQVRTQAAAICRSRTAPPHTLPAA